MNFHFRPGQEAMISAVENAIFSRQVLCLESGTGTGKTIGYLWPSIHAVASGARGVTRVVISTSTHALQEQIIRKDIPLLSRVLAGSGLHCFPSVTVLKGRQNYLCLDRFETWQQGFFRVSDLSTSRHILDWVRQTRTGERSGFPFPEFWEAVNVAPDACHGKQCLHYHDCFLVSARREAADSGLLIVNHHLYFSDLLSRRSGGMGLLPEHDAVIFDEAHDIDDIVTAQLGGELSRARLARLLRDITAYWQKHVTVPDPAGLLADISERVANYWDCLTDMLRGQPLIAEPLRGHTGRSGSRDGQFLTVLPSLAEKPSGELRHASGRLELFLRQMEEWFSSCANDTSLPPVSRLPAERLAERCQSVRTEMEWFMSPPAADHARWVTWQDNQVGGLHYAPLEISETLKEHLFTPGRAVIFTSATLTVQAGSFAFFQGRIGCPSNTVYRRIRSPFAYDRQAALYLPGHLPSPNDEHFVEAAFPVVQNLLQLTRGRTLLLCTSFAHLQRFHELLAAHGKFPVLRQGDAPARELIDTFRRTPGAVLVGALTFWQGVDIEGQSLVSVIIDRIPFPSPADPVVHFRQEYLRGQGRSAFTEDSLPRALLMLRQGFGRLIRSAADQGIVTILDPRTHRYRQAILSTLPGGLPVFHEWNDLVRHVSSSWPEICCGDLSLTPAAHPSPATHLSSSPMSDATPFRTPLSPFRER